MNYEIQIEKLLTKRIEAIISKDVEKVISDYSDTVHFFDVVGELQQFGYETMKMRLKQWLNSMSDDIKFEIWDKKIEASEDLASCCSLNHIKAALMQEGELDMWWRETLIFRRVNSEWKIIHSHSSVPFDPQSGKPSLELKPKDQIE
ncbi:nuclear transport factor 2 family protein [soil metagenome]